MFYFFISLYPHQIHTENAVYLWAHVFMAQKSRISILQTIEIVWKRLTPTPQIWEVQNPELYQKYQVHKRAMEKRLPKVTCERQLFHGTTERASESISKCGFSRSYAGKNGIIFFFHYTNLIAVCAIDPDQALQIWTTLYRYWLHCTTPTFILSAFPAVASWNGSISHRNFDAYR